MLYFYNKNKEKCRFLNNNMLKFISLAVKERDRMQINRELVVGGN